MDLNQSGLVHRAVVVLAVLALPLAACAHGPNVGAGADPGVERERLRERESSFLTALGARDAERAAAHFAEDAVLHVANMPPIEGRVAIRRFYGNVFRFMNASAPAPETLRISSGADLAYTTGRVTNTFTGEQGPVEYAGKYLLVWERREGEWLVAVYALSNDRSDPPRR